MVLLFLSDQQYRSDAVTSCLINKKEEIKMFGSYKQSIALLVNLQETLTDLKSKSIVQLCIAKLETQWNDEEHEYSQAQGASYFTDDEAEQAFFDEHVF